MRAILMEQRTRQGEVSLFDTWQTKGNEKYPSRLMYSIFAYNLDDECLERISFDEKDLQKLKVTDLDGNIIKLEDCVAKLGGALLWIVEFEVNHERRGSFLLEKIVAVKVVEQAEIAH